MVWRLPHPFTQKPIPDPIADQPDLSLLPPPGRWGSAGAVPGEKKTSTEYQMLPPESRLAAGPVGPPAYEALAAQARL